jgi:hypothetical protein
LGAIGGFSIFYYPSSIKTGHPHREMALKSDSFDLQSIVAVSEQRMILNLGHSKYELPNCNVKVHNPHASITNKGVNLNIINESTNQERAVALLEDRMVASRRSFLKAGALAPLSVSALNEIMAVPSEAQGLDQTAHDFWANQAGAPYDKFMKGLNARGATFSPTFIFVDPVKGFQRSENLDTSDLPKNGSVNVSIQVQRFRPSQSMAQQFTNAPSGSLRVDVKQTTPLPNIGEALAWTAMAAVVPKAGNQLPSLSNLTFDPGQSWGQLTQIPLTNGLGFWNWNFFLQKPQGFWGELINIFRVADKAVFPLLGLPGIAISALSSVNNLLGLVQAKQQPNWIFKSQDSPVYATQEAKDKIGFGLPLKSGQYIVLPADPNQLHEFGVGANNLELQGGYLVTKGTGQFDWESNATQQVPTVSYMIVDVKVSPVTGAGGSDTKQGKTSSSTTRASPDGCAASVHSVIG